MLTLELGAQHVPELTFRNIEICEAQKEGQGIIQVLEDSQGYLWTTSSMGVYRYDGRIIRSYFQQSDSLSLSGNYTEMLFEDRDHNVWVGSTNGGIDRYDREQDHFVRVISPHAGIGHVVRMIQDVEGTLWIAGATGLYALDPQSLRLVRHAPDRPPRVRGAYGFRGIALDSTSPDMLWVTGVEGAYHFNITSGKFESLDMKGDYMLMDVHQTSQNQLWCGSWGGGVMSCDLTTHKWKNHVPEELKDGRSYHVVKAILPMDTQRLWVAGGAGFGLFDRNSETFSFYPFTKAGQAGIDSSFSFAGICTTRQGNMVVTNLEGFSISSSLTGADNRLMYAPAMLAIEIEGKPYLTDSTLSYINYVYLDEREKNIAFTLCTPGNYTTEPVQFEYRLEGYDKGWEALHEGRMARYTNLPRGQYRFTYRARIGDQDWLDGRAVRIEKEVVFFMKPGFYITTGVVLAGLIFLFYRLRVQRIRNEAKLKTEFNKKLADTEMAVLRTQMNPHFMFNSLNSIKYYILNEETENANKYLTKFSKLMRLVLKNSQSKLVNLSDELEALNLYIELESLRFKEEFKYEINVDEKINEEDTYVPPLIIQPYVENAIWHGLLQKAAPGTLTVSINKKDGFIRVEVSDDGIGRKAAEELRSKSATKKSFGTKITRDRIALVREIIGIDASVTTHDLQNTNGSAAGTRVVIKMPYIAGKKVDQLNLN